MKPTTEGNLTREPSSSVDVSGGAEATITAACRIPNDAAVTVPYTSG